MQQDQSSASPPAADDPTPAVKTYVKSEDFQFEDADFILHSTPYAENRESTILDRITVFRVHQAKLRRSPVFADLLELGSTVPTSDLFEGLPFVRLEEHPNVIGPLLLFLYEDIRGFPKKFSRLVTGYPSELYEACFKYDMPVAVLAVEYLLGGNGLRSRWATSVLIDCYRLARRNERKNFENDCLECLAEEEAADWDPEALTRLCPEELIALMSARELYLQNESKKAIAAIRGDTERPRKASRLH